MALRLNSALWKRASLRHFHKHLGYLPSNTAATTGGGVVKPPLFSSSYSLFLFNNPFTTSASDHPKPPYSAPPYLLLPHTKNFCDESIVEGITKAVNTENCTDNDEDDGPTDYCFYNPADKKLVKLHNVRSKSNILVPNHSMCIGSSHGWLAYVDLVDHNAVYLTNPLASPPTTIALPSFETLPHPVRGAFRRLEPPIKDKIVMSCPPTHEDCVVMALVDCITPNRGAFDQIRLAFCRIGDSSWTQLDSPNHRTPDDIVYSDRDGVFYSRDCSGLYAWNARALNSPPRRIEAMAQWRVNHHSRFCQERVGSNHLVMDSCSGDVLVVTRYFRWTEEDDNLSVEKRFKRTNGLNVFRLNARKKGWDHVSDLGGGAVFVGLNHGFKLSAGEFDPAVLAPNSIYFTVAQPCEIGFYSWQDFKLNHLFGLHQFNDVYQSSTVWFRPNPSNE